MRTLGVAEAPKPRTGKINERSDLNRKDIEIYDLCHRMPLTTEPGFLPNIPHLVDVGLDGTTKYMGGLYF